MVQAFVTGGSGFIGRALVRRLIADGVQTKVLVRSESSAEKVRALGAEAVVAELTDPTTWQADVIGSDVLFHLAAETDASAPWERHELVTVQGTRAAVAAARHAGVPRFVLCGSEAANLAGDPLIEADETVPLQPHSAAAYCAAKAQAEQIVIDANGRELTTVVIRPRFVWGPESILIENLVAAARAGELGWVDGGRHITDVTYVDNVVEGLILGWKVGHPGEAYFITDRHRVVFRDFLQSQLDIYGVTAALPEIDAAVADREITVPFRWFLGQECTLVTDKAVKQLGYQPIVSHETGIRAVRDALTQ